MRYIFLDIHYKKKGYFYKSKVFYEKEKGIFILTINGKYYNSKLP